MKKHIHFIFRRVLVFAVAGAFCMALPTGAKANTIGSLNDSMRLNNLFNNPFATSKLIQCYPNPATTYINFKFDNSVVHSSKLFIYSFTGRQMNELSVTDNLIKVSLDNYFRGLYLYQLRDANGNILESGKFQVKN
ncbi:MAG TPA: T9SS type A sorting domain-containing protein [Arachidicoccus sp.]